MMRTHIEWFKFHLGNRQSIGPATLRALWSDACDSFDISVNRQMHSIAGHTTVTYSLCASPRLQNPKNVELRMRKLLEASNYAFSMTVIHH